MGADGIIGPPRARRGRSLEETLIEKLEPLYDATLRRVGPLHGVLKEMVWVGGDLLVRAASRLTRFELPEDRLLPLYKLEMLLGTYESQTVRQCRRYIRPGMTVVDVGAHVGYYTLLFSRLVGSAGLVLSFEPHPANFEILRRNVDRCGLRNVRLFPFAVSDREGNASFWETPLSTGHSLQRLKPGARKLTLATTSLDATCGREGVRRLDFVKMDVEGGELEVLQGMAGLAAHSPRLAIVMEFKADLLSKRHLEAAHLMQALVTLGCTELVAIRERGGMLPVRPDQADLLLELRKCNLLARIPLRDGDRGH